MSIQYLFNSANFNYQLPLILVASTCRVEHDINYDCGTDCTLNDGFDDRVDDWESCKSLCESDQATAFYFSYVPYYKEWWGADGHYSKTCWCRSSDSGRKHSSGLVSGDLNCGCKLRVIVSKLQCKNLLSEP